MNSSACDTVNGGVYTTLTAATGEPRAKTKCWWEFEQCVLGGIMNYYLNGDSRYLQFADKSMNTFMKKMYDTKYGDVFSDLDKSGTPASAQKGNYWK